MTAALTVEASTPTDLAPAPTDLAPVPTDLAPAPTYPAPAPAPTGSAARVRARVIWRRARPWLALAIVGVLVWRVGTGPFLTGIGRISLVAVLGAVALGALATWCCAWRWRVVAAGLGIDVPLRGAVAAYYRSQFLNSTLPGGVLGDVDRAVQHGKDSGDLGRSVRAVAWERSAGQIVQVVVALAVLAVAPSPARTAMPVLLAVLAVIVVVAAAARRWWRFRPAGIAGDRANRRLVRAIGTARADVATLLSPKAWPRIVAASVVMVGCHSAIFLVAARTAGSTASVGRLIPLALLALAAMSLPLSIGGWGPREGVAAWAFAASGLGATDGLATSVAYGILAIAATLPGAALLVVARFRRVPAGSGTAGRPAPGGSATPVRKDRMSV